MQLKYKDIERRLLTSGYSNSNWDSEINNSEKIYVERRILIFCFLDLNCVCKENIIECIDA